MELPNVVLTPRSLFNETMQNPNPQNYRRLFLGTVVAQDPWITPKEMEEQYGATFDEVLRLFGEDSDDTEDMDQSVGAEPAPVVPEHPAGNEESFADAAEAIFVQTIGRSSGIRPHQFKEIETRTNADLTVVQSLANIVARNEQKGDQVRFVDKFVFKVLSSTPLERLQGNNQQPQQRSQITDRVERVLSQLPEPQPSTPIDPSDMKQKMEMLKEKGLV